MTIRELYSSTRMRSGFCALCAFARFFMAVGESECDDGIGCCGLR